MELMELIKIYKHRFQNNEPVYISRKAECGFSRYTEILGEILDSLKQNDLQKDSLVAESLARKDVVEEADNHLVVEQDRQSDIVVADSQIQVEQLAKQTFNSDTQQETMNVDTAISEDGLIEVNREILNLLEAAPDDKANRNINYDLIDREDPTQPTETVELREQNKERTIDEILPAASPLKEITLDEQDSKPQRGRKKRKRGGRITKAKKIEVNEPTMGQPQAKLKVLPLVEVHETSSNPDQLENENILQPVDKLKGQSIIEASMEDCENSSVTKMPIISPRDDEPPNDTDTELNNEESQRIDESDNIIQFFSQVPQDTGPDSPDISYIPPVNLSAIATSEIQDMDLADISAFLEQDIEF
ncbi:hypothetical protein HDV06_003097 [Boothiomyces sp. JEL0866]|nr:hypothetical protein HDV06_003097 [Boothiomyces sp. JEL0866]